MDKNEEIIKLLKEYNQEHIIELLNKLDENKKEELLEQLKKIDFHQIAELYENTKKEIELKENKIESIPYLDKEKLTKNEKDIFDYLGEKVIVSGHYAVVTMAGGQGTRLGHTGPKGTFKLDVYGKGKYLFEILAENLKEANKKYNTIIPWYIMTSRENNDQTQEFLEKNNYFGYDKNSVKLFEQGELPLVDTNGKMLIGKDMKVREASDGNGGVFSSLRKTGMLSDMKERGVEWVFIGGVDNALLKMADVTLLGMAIDKNVQIASKSVVKANPHERVGVFCKMNGHPKVIEYSELPEKMAEEVKEALSSGITVLEKDRTISFHIVNIGEIELTINEILFIETAKRNVRIHTREQQYLSNRTLSEIGQELSKYGFFFVHKSTLVNLDAITEIDAQKRKVSLCNGSWVTVAGQKIPELKKRYIEHKFEYGND